MATIQLEQVSKEYPGGTRAVDEMSLTVADGEFLVLVGPSGCGKTTTLRLIAGLEQVSAGRVFIDGHDVTTLAPQERDIAMVFQSCALWPHMTVRQNLSFGPRLRANQSTWRRWLARLFSPSRHRQIRRTEEKIDHQIEDIAGLLGITKLLHRKPGQLSGGERQRVAVGRALIRQPKAFLFDEPLAALEAGLRLDMRRELRRLHERLAATMLYVTHDQVEAMSLGARIAVMSAGRICQVGEPLAIYDRPANRFVAELIGSPPMNFVSGRVETIDDGPGFRSRDLAVKLGGRGMDTPELRPGQQVQLGIRPEHVLLEGAFADSFGPASSVSRHGHSGGAAGRGDHCSSDGWPDPLDQQGPLSLLSSRRAEDGVVPSYLPSASV